MSNNAEYGLVGEGRSTLTEENLSFCINIIVGTEPKSIKNCTIELGKTAYEQTGKTIQARVIVKDGDKVLVKDTDYTVTYKNTEAIGTASLTIKGKGNYEDAVT